MKLDGLRSNLWSFE